MISSTGPTPPARPAGEKWRPACTTRRRPLPGRGRPRRVDPGGARRGVGLPLRGRAGQAARPAVRRAGPHHRRRRRGRGWRRRWPAAGPTPGQSARAVAVRGRGGGTGERAGAPELVADCLDAALAAHWGPDELERAPVAGRPARRRRRPRPRSRTPGCRPTCGACRWPARRWTCRRCTGRCGPWNCSARSRPGAVLRRVAAADARPAARPDRHHGPVDQTRRGRRRTGVASLTPGWCSRPWTPTRRPSPATLPPAPPGRPSARRSRSPKGVTAVVRRGGLPLGLRRASSTAPAPWCTPSTGASSTTCRAT